MNLKQIAFGVSTFLPGMSRFKSVGTGGTDSARYCYSVWLRHMALAGEKGMNTDPAAVAELGPGDSLGIGLAALIAGAERYYAFDVVEHANVSRNLAVFDEIVALFRARADIPGMDEFPGVKPYLKSYAFPARIFPPGRLEKALEPSRIARIRASVEDVKSAGSMIEYQVPWYDPKVLKPASVDIIFSQAVLEHVDDLENTYRSMRQWLKPDGYISHQIDFRCHKTADEWNGHWAYSDFTWRLIRGNRPFLLNREPYSTHARMLRAAGFVLTTVEKLQAESRLRRNQLAPRFRAMDEEDLTTTGAYIQAVGGTHG